MGPLLDVGGSSGGSKLAQAKTYGGVGSILVILSIVPYAGLILGIVGLVLVLIAVKYISDEVGDPGVFNNMLYSVLAGVIGIAIVTVFGFGMMFSMFGLGMGPPQIDIDDVASGIVEATETETAITIDIDLGFESLLPVILTVFAVLLVVWIVLVVSALFLKRSLDSIARHLGVGLFSTAAILYLIGAVLTVVMVGFILILIAWILIAVAFFSLPDKPPSSPSSSGSGEGSPGPTSSSGGGGSAI